MKRLLSVIALCLLLPGAGLYAQTECARKVEAGTVSLCMPKLEGMNETYDIPAVKMVVDASDGAGNYILGVYLPDSLYARVDEIPGLALSDYFKVYMTAASVNTPVKPELLKSLEKELTSYLSKEKWDALKEKVENANAGLEIGKPILLETYYTGISAVSYQMLIPVQRGDDALTVVSHLTQAVIRNRLVWIAYYTRLNGEASLLLAKAQGATILRKMQAANL